MNDRLALVPRESGEVPEEAHGFPGQPPDAPGQADGPNVEETTLLQYAVALGRPGRVAVVGLPKGMTAIETLMLIQQLPAISSAASQVPVDPEAEKLAAIRAMLTR